MDKALIGRISYLGDAKAKRDIDADPLVAYTMFSQEITP